MVVARTPAVVVGKAVVAAPARGRWGGVASWGVHPSPLCPTRRCTSLRHHGSCRKNPANSCWPMIGCPASLPWRHTETRQRGEKSRVSDDTQWEAYKEDVQSEIRREMNNDGKDLEKRLERKLDLDYGKADWMYTAHFSQEIVCPSTSRNPSRRK